MNDKQTKNYFIRIVKTIREYSTVITLSISFITLIIVAVTYFTALNSRSLATASDLQNNDNTDRIEHQQFKDAIKSISVDYASIDKRLNNIEAYFKIVPK